MIGDEKGLKALTPLTRDMELVKAELNRVQGWAISSPGGAEGRQVQDNIKARIELAEMDQTCGGTPPCLCVAASPVIHPEISRSRPPAPPRI